MCVCSKGRLASGGACLWTMTPMGPTPRVSGEYGHLLALLGREASPTSNLPAPLRASTPPPLPPPTLAHPDPPHFTPRRLGYVLAASGVAPGERWRQRDGGDLERRDGARERGPGRVLRALQRLRGAAGGGTRQRVAGRRRGHLRGRPPRPGSERPLPPDIGPLPATPCSTGRAANQHPRSIVRLGS